MENQTLEIKPLPERDGLEQCHSLRENSGREVGRMWTCLSGNIGWIKQFSFPDESPGIDIKSSLLQYAREYFLDRGANFFGFYVNSGSPHLQRLKDEGWVEMGEMLTVLYPLPLPNEIPEMTKGVSCQPLEKKWESMDPDEQKWVEVFLESGRVHLNAQQFVDRAAERENDTILLIRQNSKLVGVVYSAFLPAENRAEVLWIGKSVDLSFDTATKLIRAYWADPKKGPPVETVFHFNTFFLGKARKYCRPGSVVDSKTVLVNENMGTCPYSSLLSGFHFG